MRAWKGTSGREIVHAGGHQAAGPFSPPYINISVDAPIGIWGHVFGLGTCRSIDHLCFESVERMNGPPSCFALSKLFMFCAL